MLCKMATAVMVATRKQLKMFLLLMKSHSLIPLSMTLGPKVSSTLSTAQTSFKRKAAVAIYIAGDGLRAYVDTV